MSGELSNQNYESAAQHYIDFKENSKLGLALNLLMIFLGLGGAILNNNEFSGTGKLLTVVAILSLLFFMIVYQKTISKQSEFYRLLDIKFFKKSFIFILLGIALFYFYRIYFIKKMEEDLKKIS